MKIEGYSTTILYWMILSVIVFLTNLFITAPYGRHTSTKWGKLIDYKLGWFLMEFPALVIFPSLALLFNSGTNSNLFVSFFILFWLVHYINRTIIYPIRMKSNEKQIPIAICVMAFIFNFVNGSFIGNGLTSSLHLYSINWLFDPRFILGLSLSITGIYINWTADTKLINIKKTNKSSKYEIPRTWLFEYISCPNHFGEIIEWLGFAFMTWNFASFAFALWTFANLLPRALAHHKWYKKEFPSYPKNRKAVIPYLL